MTANIELVKGFFAGNWTEIRERMLRGSRVRPAVASFPIKPRRSRSFVKLVQSRAVITEWLQAGAKQSLFVRQRKTFSSTLEWEAVSEST